MRRRTPTYLLADHLLRSEGGLETFVRTRRAKGISWRFIARDVYEATDHTIDVTFEILRRWFVDDNANGDAGEAA